MGVTLHKPADNNGRGFVHTYGLMNGHGYHMSTDSNLHNGHGFVHTYTLINGHGYHMSTDCNLRKWAWLTKEAELC